VAELCELAGRRADLLTGVARMIGGACEGTRRAVAGQLRVWAGRPEQHLRRSRDVSRSVHAGCTNQWCRSSITQS